MSEESARISVIDGRDYGISNTLFYKLDYNGEGHFIVRDTSFFGNCVECRDGISMNLSDELFKKLPSRKYSVPLGNERFVSQILVVASCVEGRNDLLKECLDKLISISEPNLSGLDSWGTS